MNQPVQALARFLEGRLQRIVVDETGLQGKYDFELPCDMSKPEAVTTAVREQFGMELTQARRAVELMIVEKILPVP